MTEKQTKITEFIKKHPQATSKEVGDACGCSKSYAKHSLRQLRKHGTPSQRPLFKPGAAPELSDEPAKEDLKPGERRVTKQEGDDTVAVTVRSCDIKTLDDALKYAEVDLTVWEVDHWVCNSWEVTMKHSPKTTTEGGAETGVPYEATTEHQRDTYTNFQVKVWLRLLVPKVITNAVDLVVASMKQYAPQYPVIVRSASKSKDNIMLEISPFDPHLGMLAWAPETGADWDIKIAVEVLRNAVSDILQRASSMSVRRIVIPVGQDFYHLNSTEYVTPKAQNVLSVDGRFPKIYLSGYECMRGMIDDCLAVAPVELKYVPGNHDKATSFTLCHALSAHYDNCKHVTVDLSPKARKVIVHGRVLLGFTHGELERGRDLPMLFASEFREEFGKCDWFEIHTGHLHRMRETRLVTGDSYDGSTRVRILPSLAALEAYAYEAGYSNARCCEAYLWSDSDAYLGHLSVNARSEKIE